MTLHYTDDWLTVLHGDVRDELRTLPDVVTRNIRSIWTIATQPYPAEEATR